MKSTNRMGLKARINYAEKAYLGEHSLDEREFDNCFEMGDGDKVVAELTRRAKQNPTLWDAISRDFGGTFPERWVQATSV